MDKPSEDHQPPDRAQYTLTVGQASELFFKAGTPRSPRTIIRYCSQSHLDCIKVDTDKNERYLISRASIDRRIQELQQIATFSHVATERDGSRHDSPRLDSVGEKSPVEFEGQPDLKQKIDSLNAKIMDLKITNRAKDYFLGQLKSERADLLDQVTRQSRRLGELETRLQLNEGIPPSEPPPISPDYETGGADADSGNHADDSSP